jgi:SAM-dependent methyltransferase
MGSVSSAASRRRVEVVPCARDFFDSPGFHDGATGGCHKALKLLRKNFWTSIRCRCERLWLRGLRLMFRFDAWHASAPYSCRPYKKTVVGLVNALAPRTAVEVGCGLGEILSRVTATERFGFDQDGAAIRAARFLHGRRIHWKIADLAAVPLSLPEGRRIDCLIMVNWIHNLSPEQLGASLLPLLSRTGWLILDAIDRDGPASYRYKHDFAFLSAVAERVSVTPVPGEPRSLIIFKVSK